MNNDLLNYDQHLSRSCRKLPAGAARPCPSTLWPEENIRLYQKYRVWLIEGGAGLHATGNIYLPIAGHILGLNPLPYPQLDLIKDFEKVLDFARARGGSPDRLVIDRHALVKFRRFVRLELGQGEAPKFKTFDLAAHTQGLPAWLVSELERYQRSLQRNWRPVRIMANLQGFWSKYGKMWRYFCEVQGVQQLADLKRAHILAFIDQWIDAKYSSSTINCYILYLRSFLNFLQEEGYNVPQSLLRVKTLKTPDSLPRYLNDEQVIGLRDEIRSEVQQARQSPQRRQALMDQAIFYLLWQGGLRVGEMEELRLEDLDLPGKRLSVRNGKGQKDRTIYLTDVAIAVLRQYLDVRGMSTGEHVFLYRNAPLGKCFIGSRLKTLGEKLSLNAHPHRLRHTTATQLLNAGCRITSIQKILGHENINTTMRYAKAYNQTVAEDFYAAMQRVEQRLSVVPASAEPEPNYEVIKVQDRAQLLAWVELLTQPELGQDERLATAWQLKQVLAAAASP